MEPYPIKRHSRDAFALAEVCVALAVCALFGAAAFATNERLLSALREQKETTAAAMMLQERMESFRTLPYSQVADTNYVGNNIVPKPTTSEQALGGLSETITVSGYLTTAGTPGYPTDGSTVNQWVRDSQHPNGQWLNQNLNLVSNYSLVQVDILISWMGTNGRTRSRNLTAHFGKGNCGP